jgi:tartrate dehydratase beta subunit/fumarate hydratase class I family protein
MVSPEHENATIEVGTAGPATSQREQVLECLLKELGFRVGQL